MSLSIIGISHKTASISLRNQVGIPEQQFEAALARLREDLGITQAVILSTCNRTEIYAITPHPEAVLAWLAAYRHLDQDLLAQHGYCYHDSEAVRHGLRVACGLDSMVMGEPQILGQLKAAYKFSQQHGMMGTKMNFVMQQILNQAKKIRHQTALGYCPVSVAFSAVKLAKSQQSVSANTRALVIGAGETSALLIKHLLSIGITRIDVVNRTLTKAEALLQHADMCAYDLSWLDERLACADWVISATSAESPLVTKAQMLEAMQHSNHSRFIVDLAVPQDIEPAVASLDNVHYYNVDDIGQMIQKNTLQRTQAATLANDMVEQALVEYQEKRNALDATSTITDIRQKLQGLCDKELQNSLAQLARGENPEAVLQQFAYRLTNKWSHHPSHHLHQACAKGEHHWLDAAKGLFGV